MNFEFSEDQNLLRDQAQSFLREKCPLDRVRTVLDGKAEYADDVWRAMIDMGWTATAIPEAYGGIGLGQLELCVLAEELGRSLAPTPFSSSVYLATEALLQFGSETQKQAYLPALASGEKVGCFAMAEGAKVVSGANLETRFDGTAVTGVKVPVADGGAADFAIVLAAEGDGSSLAIVDLTARGCSRTPVTTVDPTRPHVELTLDGAPGERLGGAGEGMALTTALFDRAAVLFAFEQVGGAQAALEMAREYAMGRFAFGRPIASYQAIKHKLADMYIAQTLAHSNAYYGAWALSTSAPELPVAAATARVSATQAFHECAKENIQTHGGMGFTWEFNCHLYYRRAKLLSLNLGGLPRWQERLVSSLEQSNLQVAS